MTKPRRFRMLKGNAFRSFDIFYINSGIKKARKSILLTVFFVLLWLDKNRPKDLVSIYDT